MGWRVSKVGREQGRGERASERGRAREGGASERARKSEGAREQEEQEGHQLWLGVVGGVKVVSERRLRRHEEAKQQRRSSTCAITRGTVLRIAYSSMLDTTQLIDTASCQIMREPKGRRRRRRRSKKGF